MYAATHVETGQRAAVKVLSPELAVAEGFRERFEAEIESLRLLKHPGIVQLYGYGEDNGSIFYSMEIVDGASLEEELRSGRRFNWREVTSIAVQVCQALKHAHDHGVIHRDIKPANILIDQEENSKLADFGIARLFGSTQLTSAGGVLGTADFMSPEQADGRPVTDRCDQYSLGCVMYALLTGRPPFRGSTLPEMLQLQRYAKPEPVRRYAPRTPEHLERTIAQLLEKSPEDRFPNAKVLSRHLEAMRLALTKPARDDFSLNESDQDTDDLDEEALDVTQIEGDYSDSPSVSLPGASLTEVRNQETRLADSDGDGSENGGGAEPPRPSFTVVGDDGPAATHQGVWPVVAPLALMAVLVAIVAGVGYLVFRPQTADELYAAIEATDEDDWEEGDAEVFKRLDSFVERFPDDPRIESLQPRIEQSELLGLEKRLRMAAIRNERSDGRLPPAEQLFVSALRSERAGLGDAADQFERVATLLAGSGGAEEEQISRLARQHAGRLRSLSESKRKKHLPFAEGRLAAAEELSDTDPAQAAKVCRALIATYGNHSWAEELVTKAKDLLAEVDEQDSER